jgi:hypothetical protein
MAVARAGVRVNGYREFVRAANRTSREARKEIREALRDVGEVVRADAADRFSTYDEQSAGGFRVRVRERGVAVEQSHRRTTGTRPDFGALQMRRALIPAGEENEQDVDERMQEALESIADYFELIERWRGQGLL